MSWWSILVLAVGAYACKALGLVVLGRRATQGPVLRAAGLFPPALLAALIAVQTFDGGRALVVDARAAGIAAAAVAVWRRAPFVVVVAVAAVVTATVRAMG